MTNYATETYRCTIGYADGQDRERTTVLSVTVPVGTDWADIADAACERWHAMAPNDCTYLWGEESHAAVSVRV